DTHRVCRIGVAVAGVGGGDQIVCRHQIREDVVADDRRVLVGTGDAVEVPDAVPVVVPERHPQARGFDQHLQAALLLQVVVTGDGTIPLEGHGDVGVDVPGRRAGRPVGRALLPADGSPGKAGT